MAYRDHRVGLATTTISVKLTAPELEALDNERRQGEPLPLYEDRASRIRLFHEGRGDALRRLIAEAAERRTDEVKRRDPRQVTLTEAIEAAAAPAAEPGKTRRRNPGSRRSVRPAGAEPRSRRLARIRG